MEADLRSTITVRVSTIYNNAKRRAQDHGIEFDITQDDIHELWKGQQGRCALTGQPMLVAATPQHDELVSLDRIDSNGGYTRCNIQLVFNLMNKMKGTSTSVAFNQRAMRYLMESHVAGRVHN